MKIVTVLALIMSTLLFPQGSSISATPSQLADGPTHSAKTDNIIGDWFAQIDIPQNDLVILLEFNLLDDENCVITGKWQCVSKSKEESGKAKYVFEGNTLIITFLNEDEIIRTDHVFYPENRYEVNFDGNKLTILNNRQFRNVDVNFGRGYENRGFAKIIF